MIFNLQGFVRGLLNILVKSRVWCNVDKRNKDPKFMSREEHERNTMIENLVWEAAKKIKPNSYINPQLIRKATADLIATFQEL